jgi:SH3-like domain-containing protein
MMNRFPNKSRLFFPRVAGAAIFGLLAWLSMWAAAAQTVDTNGQTIGRVSGLPVPRFVSLKADRVNLREGPSRDHRTTWIYERAGLPVEITAEFGVWRKVRDSDGTEGWVLHNLLSGRRTALVAPWKKDVLFTLYAQPAANSTPLARLQPGVIGSIKTCDGSWCEIFGDGFDGYIQQDDLWGVYPNEKID